MQRSAIKIRRFLSRLLCVLILNAALDRVPDPPVLKPKRDRTLAACLDSTQAAVGFFNHQPDHPALPPVLNLLPPVPSFAAIKALPVGPLRVTSTDLWRAADLSPPTEPA